MSAEIVQKFAVNAPATREEEVMETFRKGIRDAAAELFGGEGGGGGGLHGSEGGRGEGVKTCGCEEVRLRLQTSLHEERGNQNLPSMVMMLMLQVKTDTT